MLLPLYAAFAAALVFYLLIPVAGAFMLRNQWRRFRERAIALSLAPSLRYSDIAAAERQGRSDVGLFRLFGTIEAIEGIDRIWLRGKHVSALVDLSRAPLYVAPEGTAGAPAEAGSIVKLNWRSVSSLVEGTSIFVAGTLSIEDGRPVFVDSPDSSLVAVCYDGGEAGLLSRLVAGGRAPNEYWNNPTRISLAIGLAVISGLLLLMNGSLFSSVRTLIFLAGAAPVLPFAPPGLALFFVYFRLWRRALSSRITRDLIRLPLRFTGERRTLPAGEVPPEGSTWIGLPDSDGDAEPLILFTPAAAAEEDSQAFVVRGEPEPLARRMDRRAAFYAGAASAAFGLAIIVNFVLAFLAWRWLF